MGTGIGSPSLPTPHSCLLGEWSGSPPTQYPAISTAAYNAAAREIARAKGERHLPGSYRLVTNDVYRARFLSAPLPIGASIWYHSFDGSWWLGKVKQPSNAPGRYVVRFLDNPGPALIDPSESAYNTAPHAPCGSWSPQTHGRTNPLQGVLHGLPLSLCPLAPFVPSLPQVYHVYTEDPHVYTKVCPLMPNLTLSSLLSPAYSGSPVLLPLFYCLLRTARSTAKILLCHQDAYVDAQDRHIRRSSLCLQPRPYIYSSAPFGELDTVARPFGKPISTLL